MLPRILSVSLSHLIFFHHQLFIQRVRYYSGKLNKPLHCLKRLGSGRDQVRAPEWASKDASFRMELHLSCAARNAGVVWRQRGRRGMCEEGCVLEELREAEEREMPPSDPSSFCGEGSGWRKDFSMSFSSTLSLSLSPIQPHLLKQRGLEVSPRWVVGR